MAISTADWPPLLIPTNAEFWPENQTRTGGLSISGAEQIVTSPAGRWRCRMDIPVRGESRVLALRAFLAQMQGRAGTVLVPKWDRYRPRNINGRRFSELATSVYGTDCELNFDLSGFGQQDVSQGSLTEDASLGATSITVNITDGEGPRPGHYFGIGHRLYIVQHVWQDEVVHFDTLYTHQAWSDDRIWRDETAWETAEAVEPTGIPVSMQFWPPLREAASEGASVILDRPVCLMRLASDDSGQMVLNWRRSGIVTLEFTEAL